MFRKLLIIQLIVFTFSIVSSGQVRIRIFADRKPQSAIFTVVHGKYEMDLYDGESIRLIPDEPVILVYYNNKVAVKIRNSKSFMCDSLSVKGLTGKDRFSVRIKNGTEITQYYTGDLQCVADLGTLVFINTCDIEKYLAGVVRTESGISNKIEYLKSQAVLARTYTYKYFERHILDRYNLCDNTHCQAFKGITADSVINRAVSETKGLVVLAPDSTLIISAFHSNCGGETAASEDVWLSGSSYLIRINDPYCLKSSNAVWKKKIPLTEWEEYLKNAGYLKTGNNTASYNFSQLTRMRNYSIGNFSLPFSKIRDDFKLRSSFFSVVSESGSIVLRGRGYGHGVGLCQEGAKVMASQGFKFRNIIGFYYSGVFIADIGKARRNENPFNNVKY